MATHINILNSGLPLLFIDVQKYDDHLFYHIELKSLLYKEIGGEKNETTVMIMNECYIFHLYVQRIQSAM